MLPRNFRVPEGILDISVWKSDFKFTTHDKSDNSVESYLDILPELVSIAFLLSTESVEF